MKKFIGQMGRDGSPNRPHLQAEPARAERASREEAGRLPEMLTSFASLRSNQGRLGEPSLPHKFSFATNGNPLSPLNAPRNLRSLDDSVRREAR